MSHRVSHYAIFVKWRKNFGWKESLGMAMQQTPSVSERALQLLEIIAKAEQPPTLNELIALVGLPKATTHRFVTLLETLGFAQRTPDGRRYQVGHRLTALAIDVMRNSLSQAP